MTDERIPDTDEDAPTERFAVLEFFGVKLEVSNPRLAELLTMDAGTALVTDVRELAAMPRRATSADGRVVAGSDPETFRDIVQEAAQAVDVELQPPTPAEVAQAEARAKMRARVAKGGQALGFSVRSNGVWESPTGIVIVARGMESGISPAAASHFVEQLELAREEAGGADAAVLFVTEDQAVAESFKVAIRQRKVHHLMRTVSLANVETMIELLAADTMAHEHAVALLAPVADIDVGDMLSVIASRSE